MNTVEGTGDTKVCRECGTSKLKRDSFYRVNWGDGYMNSCKACHLKWMTKHQAIRIATGDYAQYHREYRARRKQSHGGF